MEHLTIEWARPFIGPDSNAIAWWQMTIRGGVIFVYGIALVRLAGKRTFGKNSAFDIVLAIVVGSNLSRTLTASAPFVQTLLATAGLVVLHQLFARIAYSWSWFGRLIKGDERQLVRAGRMDRRAMRSTLITEHDLMEALRLNAGSEELRPVKAAYLERNGDISIVRRS